MSMESAGRGLGQAMIAAVFFLSCCASMQSIAQTTFWETIYDKTNPGIEGFEQPCDEGNGDLGFDSCEQDGGTDVGSGPFNKFVNYVHPVYGDVLIGSAIRVASSDPSRYALGDLSLATPLGDLYESGLFLWKEDAMTGVQSWEEFTVPEWDETCTPNRYSTVAYPKSVLTMAVHEVDGLLYAVGVLSGGDPVTYSDPERTTATDCNDTAFYDDFVGLFRWNGTVWDAVVAIGDSPSSMISYGGELHIAGAMWNLVDGSHTIRWSLVDGVGRLSRHSLPDAESGYRVSDLCGFNSSNGSLRVFATGGPSYLGEEMRILRMDITSNPDHDEWEEEVMSTTTNAATYKLGVLEVAGSDPRLVIAGESVQLAGDSCPTAVHFREQDTGTFLPVSGNALYGQPYEMVVSGGPCAVAGSIQIGGANLEIFDGECESDGFVGHGLVSILIPSGSTGNDAWVASDERFSPTNSEPTSDNTQIHALAYFSPQDPARTRLAVSGSFAAIWIVGNEAGESPWAAQVCFSRRIADDRCGADFNRDGFIDFFDYDDYVNCFENNVCPPCTTADYNGDDFVDFFD